MSIDRQDPHPVAWGSTRLILTIGTHHIRMHVTLAPEFGESSAVAQRQIFVTEMSDLAVEYKPARVPGFPGRIVVRKPTLRAAEH